MNRKMNELLSKQNALFLIKLGIKHFIKIN